MREMRALRLGDGKFRKSVSLTVSRCDWLTTRSGPSVALFGSGSVPVSQPMKVSALLPRYSLSKMAAVLCLYFGFPELPSWIERAVLGSPSQSPRRLVVSTLPTAGTRYPVELGSLNQLTTSLAPASATYRAIAAFRSF